MTAATVTLPTPKITTPFSPYADERGRSRKATFVVTEPTEETPGSSVVLSVSHDKHRKRFSAYLQPVKTEASRNGFSVETFMLFSGAAVATEPVARFSAKALEAFLQTALAKVEALVETNAEVAALFADPSTASDKMFGRN